METRQVTVVYRESRFLVIFHLLSLVYIVLYRLAVIFDSRGVGFVIGVIMLQLVADVIKRRLTFGGSSRTLCPCTRPWCFSAAERSFCADLVVCLGPRRDLRLTACSCVQICGNTL